MDESSPDECPLEVRLFGPFDVRVHGQRLRALRTRKGQWLLALLALRHGREVQRDWLAARLWPDSDESQILPNLRRTLTDLRDALGAQGAQIRSPTANTLSLDVSTGVAVDVARFDAAVAAGTPADLKEAVRLYRGPLLEDCQEEWIVPDRTEREQAYLQALETLARRAVDDAQPQDAAAWLRRVVAAAPTREGAWRLLMQALADGGDPAEMAQCYRQLSSYLRRELDAAPDPQTTALYQRLRDDAQRRPVAPARRPPAREAVRDEPGRGSPPKGSGSLPQPFTSFIGRESEQAAVAKLLASSRLVTLTGAGGVGKSRLALQMAAAAAPERTDGAWWVALDALSDATLVPRAVATVLGVQEEAARPLQETLVDRLRERSLLLVLDNAEHLVQACATLASALLEGCGGLSLLVTSRTVLNVQGEVPWRVPSLSLPASAQRAADRAGDAAPDPAALLDSAAVRLFCERAKLRRPTFEVNRENARALVQACRRLDGIPLAIELAAARVHMLSVAEIAERLDRPLALLTRGNETAPARHRTLRAALDWSYELLPEPERLLLGCLSVFAGGCTLEDVEAVCERVRSPAAAVAAPWPADVLDALSSLVDHSLVVCAEGPRERMRYRLLETVRQYGGERLDESGWAAAMKQHHADFFLELAERASAKVNGPEQQAWFAHLEAEHDNVLAALAWFRTQPDRQNQELALAAALGHFWYVRGHLTEGRRWLAEALARPGADDKAARAKALRGIGSIARNQGDLAAARSHYEEALTLFEDTAHRRNVASTLSSIGSVAFERSDYGEARAYYARALALNRELGSRHGIAHCQYCLGYVMQSQGQPASARALAEEAVATFDALGDRRGLANALSVLGTIVDDLGDAAHARRLHESALEIRRELGSRVGIAESLHSLGDVALGSGDLAAARALQEDSLAIFRDVGDAWGMATAQCSLGTIHCKLGDLAAARAMHEESLRAKARIGNRSGIADSLESLAILALAERRFARAARLGAVVESLREAIGAQFKCEGDEWRGCVAALRNELGAAAFDSSWTEGRALTVDQAVALALSRAGGEPRAAAS